ncbi:FAD dependent oxidoreductase [Lentinus tigrinus ALCF2SS1-7]|uniref:FAD dependent oxidoreductase n=1 Tax=Lentinus tigrinus ALCF2SS1-6 TaxID=1328759 RepID=A0A5C2S1I8_9APHY|nr:FAD dependent oxidoreductase [Lentinus tigrinus ALCF2SS1-6]RPD73064.1 FAD dependent oxidoreductase [Lentinus tigrinus ALCF2SS1-7]
MSTLPLVLNAFAEEQAALELPVQSVPAAALPVPNPTKSFWIDTPGANPLAKEGSEGALTHDADICIVGSGITGVSAAYHISRLLSEQGEDGAGAKGLKITILEARDFCSGATGRNGGHLTPAFFQGVVGYSALYGTDEAVRAIALEQHTASEIVKLVKDTGAEAAVDLVEGGHTTLLFTEPEVVASKADYAAAQAAGINVSDVKFLTKEEVKETYGAEYPGIHTPGHNLWPLKLVTHLYNLTKQTLGPDLTLHTNTPVTSIAAISASADSSATTASRRWNLTTPRGPIACSYVLHATNAYASHLLPHMHGPSGIIPTRGQIIALRSAAPLAEITKSSWDGNEGFEYWFPRPLAGEETEPLVILGGGRESTRPKFELYTVDDASVNPVVGETLRKFLPAAFPGKYEPGREPEMEWTGIMGYTKTRDPFVGPVIDPAKPDAYKGQYIAAGFTGHGMPRTYGCAEAVAGMIVADIAGKEFTVPDWLPRHHLTKNRLNE